MPYHASSSVVLHLAYPKIRPVVSVSVTPGTAATWVIRWQRSTPSSPYSWWESATSFSLTSELSIVSAKNCISMEKLVPLYHLPTPHACSLWPGSGTFDHCKGDLDSLLIPQHPPKWSRHKPKRSSENSTCSRTPSRGVRDDGDYRVGEGKGVIADQ